MQQFVRHDFGCASDTSLDFWQCTRMDFHRYLSPAQFCRGLQPLQAFPGQHVGEHLLEMLESARLLYPRIRLVYPDPVARRIWLERHDESYQMRGELEPDGDRWDAVVSFENALHRWQHPIAYGPSPHPLDDPSAAVQAFLEEPQDASFRPWIDRRVDVSSDRYSVLFDVDNIKSFYSTWQLLLAAEVATAGVHFWIDLSDESTANATRRALAAGEALSAPSTCRFDPIRAVRAFSQHRRALDAVVWFAEESARATALAVRPRNEARFVLNDDESATIDRMDSIAARDAVRLASLNEAEIIALAQFLSARWVEWNSQGRPRVADAFKAFLRQTIRLLELLHERDVDWIRAAIGRVDGHEKLALDEIWPDWWESEKSRVLRTLTGAFQSPNATHVSPEQLEEFVRYLETAGLEAFFWRVRSFEEHAFRGIGSRLTGLRSDLQGLAVSIEHLTQSLGATGDQLYKNFKQLWGRNAYVSKALDSGSVRRLVTDSTMLEDWPALSAAIEALRAGAYGEVIADLVWAARLRGALHYPIPVRDQFELERLFVTLLRAAATTFAESRC